MYGSFYNGLGLLLPLVGHCCSFRKGIDGKRWKHEFPPNTRENCQENPAIRFIVWVANKKTPAQRNFVTPVGQSL